MSANKLKPLDSVWMMMETPDTPMHVGVLAIFQKPAKAPESYFADLAAQLRSTEAVAPWNCCVGRGISRNLFEDEEFDLDYHFRRSALPEPGGERELGSMVSRLHGNPLDRSRPLWEFHLIEGLERDRFAFYIKIHHALVDGVNGVPALLATLASSARSRKVAPIWSQPLSTTADGGDLISNGLDNALDSVGAMARAGLEMARGAMQPAASNSFLFPRGTPRSTLNRHITAQRRFATQQIDEERIDALAEATGSTVNEMLTYLLGSSLRRFFKEYNALPDESLVGLMPVSLQERAEHLAGNAIAGLRVSLGTHLGDPLARLDAVKTSMQGVRKDRASLPEDAVTSYVMLRAAPLYASQLAGIGRLVPPLYNLVMSNTTGSDEPLYFNGARLEAVYPMAQLLQFGALSVDCVNYDGHFNVGFTGALDTLPHLQRMAVYFGKAIEDLEELIATGEVA